MLKINSIKNVNNTLKQISFKAGVQTNYGIKVPPPSNNMVEGNLFTGFVGTVAPNLLKTHERAQRIENGLEKTKLDLFA